MDLTVSFTRRDLTTRLPPGDVTFTVQTISMDCLGGPKTAFIRADGTLDALNNLYNILRGAVEIYDPKGVNVWWGCAWKLIVYNGKAKYTWTLDRLANSINIMFLLQTINQIYSGAGTQQTTGFSSDSGSVAEWGTKQIILRGDNGSLAAAQARRAYELENWKEPQLNIEPNDSGNAETYAVIEARGWWETLAWQFYENSSGNEAGFEQNSVITSEAEQMLGFGRPAMSETQFIATDKITTFGGSFGSLPINTNDENSRYFFVQGTASNNKTWTATSMPDGPGVSVIVTPTNVVDETPASASVIYVGTRIWQTFELETNNPFSAAAIDIRIRKGDSGIGNILIELYSVAAGLPNVLLATGTLTDDDVSTTLEWATAVLNTQVALVFGTTYGILIRKSAGEFDSSDRIFVGVDTALSYPRGSLQLYTDATNGWKTRPTNADLIFKVSGVVETTTQITNILGSVGEFVSTSDIDNTSGLLTVPYRDGTQTALEVIEALLKYGSSNNRRMLAKVRPDRTLTVYEQPARGGVADFLVDSDLVITQRNGVPIDPASLPCAQWANLKPLEMSPVTNKFVFVEEVEFDPKRELLKLRKVQNFVKPFDVTAISEL